MAPCPRCLIMKNQICDIGKKFDVSRRDRLAWVDNRHRKHTVELARQLLYESGKRPNSKAMAKILGPKSLAPNQVCSIFFSGHSVDLGHQQNAFSEHLGPHGFDFHTMFVVDLLHEFELGVWKATFTHLLRILHAQSGDVITTLNEQ